MQTAAGEIIFSVGDDFTLTADQILTIFERGELHAEGVRRSIEAQASRGELYFPNAKLQRLPGDVPKWKPIPHFIPTK